MLRANTKSKKKKFNYNCRDFGIVTNPHFYSAWRFILGWQINKERKTSGARLPLNANKTNEWEGRGGAAHRFPEPHSSSSSSDWRSAGSSAGAAEAFWAAHNSTWSVWAMTIQTEGQISGGKGRGLETNRTSPPLPDSRLSRSPLRLAHRAPFICRCCLSSLASALM